MNEIHLSCLTLNIPLHSPIFPIFRTCLVSSSLLVFKSETQGSRNGRGGHLSCVDLAKEETVRLVGEETGVLLKRLQTKSSVIT